MKKEDSNKSFKPSIKEAREAAGLTQEEMSVIFEIPKRTIGNWETGSRKAPAYVEKLVVEKLINIKRFNNEALQLKNELLVALAEAELLHPYKVPGMPDTYTQYNEGWCDAIDYIHGRLLVENK